MPECLPFSAVYQAQWKLVSFVCVMKSVSTDTKMLVQFCFIANADDLSDRYLNNCNNPKSITSRFLKGIFTYELFKCICFCATNCSRVYKGM